MVRFALRRVGLLGMTLFVSSLIIFAILDYDPRTVAVAILGQYYSEADVQTVIHRLALDRPAPARYAEWLSHFLRGDWGQSYVMNVPVLGVISQRLSHSAVLAGAAFLAIVPLSIALGVLAGLHEGRPLDRIISVLGLSAIALPEFVSGVFLIVVFGLWLGWFPPSAAVPAAAGPLSSLRALVLPCLTLILVDFAYIARMTRAMTAEVLHSHYVRTAVLKGLPMREVVVRHVLPNALPPTITVIASQVGWLLGGLVIVETLFAYPGLGSLSLDAALGHDIPLLEAIAMLMAVVYSVSNLSADLLYAYLNPRVRYT